MPKKRYTEEESVERNRDRNRELTAKKSRAGQDIGLVPPVKDWARRLACRADLALFLKTYLPSQFNKPFCSDHYRVIRKAQTAVIKGGLFAVAMPRGSGKTEISKGTVVYATLYGFRRFPLLIGATADAAQGELLDGVRYFMESEEFPLLLEDFPEAIFPIRALEGESKRQGGQRCCGVRTAIHWGGKFVVMPTVPPGNWIDGNTIGPAPSAGANIRATGITGRIRGFNVKGMRPDLVIPDDPQTDESAASPVGNARTERVLSRAVVGLAGPGKKIAGIMPCTVIQQGDAMDNILSHDKHPEWDSERTKLIYTFPTLEEEREGKAVNRAMELWDQYREIRYDYDPKLGEGEREKAGERATVFYLENAETMQAGARVAWAERFNDADELDALQHAMNLFYQDRRAFFSEYQNEPLPEDRGEFEELRPDQIAEKFNRMPRFIAPAPVTCLTAMIDVQQEVLFYAVCGFDDGFSGYLLDYGTFPDQRKSYFTLNDLTTPLSVATGVSGLEAQLYGGLTMLTKQLLDRDWQRDGGSSMRVERCMIDARWGDSTSVVYQFCSQSPFSAVLIPSFGKGVGASSPPITAREKKPGERFGLNWLVTTAQKRARQHVLYDTNFWKSFLAARLQVPMGSPGCFSLFGDSANRHRMYADHLTSEFRVRVEGRGRQVDEWKLTPGHRNDWLDCTVGCAVGASMQGVGLGEMHESTRQKAKPKPRTLEEMKQAARR